MVPRDLGLARLHPLCGADEVLGFEQGVAEDVGVGGHGDEFGEGHRVPDAVEEGGVVDLGGEKVSGGVWGRRGGGMNIRGRWGRRRGRGATSLCCRRIRPIRRGRLDSLRRLGRVSSGLRDCFAMGGSRQWTTPCTTSQCSTVPDRRTLERWRSRHIALDSLQGFKSKVPIQKSREFDNSNKTTLSLSLPPHNYHLPSDAPLPSASVPSPPSLTRCNARHRPFPLHAFQLSAPLPSAINSAVHATLIHARVCVGVAGVSLGARWRTDASWRSPWSESEERAEARSGVLVRLVRGRGHHVRMGRAMEFGGSEDERWSGGR